MNWRSIYHLYRSELRAAFRERNIVINTVIMPALLYPVLLWVLFNGLLFIRGQNEGQFSRIVGRDLPTEVHALLAADSDLELVDSPPGEAAELLDLGSVDVIIEATPVVDELQDNLELRVIYDSTQERSAFAEGRVSSILADYREARLESIAADYVNAREWAVLHVETENVASGDQMGAMILGLLLPLYFVIMVAAGCMYPAVDSTAGERERGTWETTLTLATSRLSIVTAKYLYVATMGFLAGALNLLAMVLTLGSVLRPLLQDEANAVEISVPLAAIPLLLLGSLVLAGSIAAAMMIFSAFARTFKEGQAMVGPIYIATMLPVLFLTREGLELTAGMALLPIVNVAMMVREALRGSFPPLEIGLVIATQVVVIGLLLRLAAAILRAEDVMTGSYDGNLLAFLRRRRQHRGRQRHGDAKS